MKPGLYVPQLLAFAVTLALGTNALADDHRHFPVRVVDHRGVVWGHGDIRHFHDFDDHAWRGGHWIHDWHDNHFGWWWIVGGAWVFYNAPVYPYPDPYVPSTVIVQQAPPPAPVPAAAPAPAYWKYCASAQNYYPYVGHVSSGLGAGAGDAGHHGGACPGCAAPASGRRTACATRTSGAACRRQYLVR